MTTTPGRLPSSRSPLKTRAAALLVSGALLLAGCSGSSAPATGNAAAPAAGGAAPKSEAPAPGAPAATVARQVAKTAQLTMVVGDPAASAKQVRDAVERLGGYVTSENVVTEQRDGLYTQPSTITVSVPGDKLDGALDELGKLGRVTYRVVKSDDVTTQVVDTEARIKTMRESIARIQSLLNQAGSVADIAKVEAELTSRQTQLESLLAQQKALAGRVAMSSVTVTLRTDAAATDPNPLLQGLEGGWTALLASIRVLLTLLGGLLPFAVLAALVAVPLLWWRRRRGRAARSVATAPTVPSPAYPTTPPDGVAPRHPDAAPPAPTSRTPQPPSPSVAPASDAGATRAPESEPRREDVPGQRP